MPYKQIELVEDYINEIDELKNSESLKGEGYFNCAKMLDKKIDAGLKEYKTNINWNDASFFDLTQGKCIYNDTTTKNYLTIMKDALRGILFSIPNYQKICMVREIICESANINKEEDKRDFIIKIATQYAGCIKISQAVQSYIEKSIVGEWIEDDTTDPLYKAILGLLKIYMEELCMEKKVEDIKSPSITMIQQQQNSQSVTNTISTTIEDCIKDLRDCVDVNEDDAEQIKKQLLEIKELLKEKRGNGKSIRNKISSILKWVADKSSSAMIAILPTLMTFLQ